MNLAVGSVPSADVPLRSHLESWVKGVVDRGLAPGTVHTRTNNVRAVLRGAVADELTRTTPAKASRSPVAGAPRPPCGCPPPPRSAPSSRPLTTPSDRSSPSAPSPTCGSAGQPPSGSRTSTSCAAASPWRGRCSGRDAWPSRSSRPSTAANEACSLHLRSSTCWPPTSPPLPGRRLVVHRRRPGPAAPEHRRPPVAHPHGRRRPVRAAAAWPPALLRLGSHRLRLRRRDRAARPRPGPGDDHAVDLLAPVADPGGPHAGRRAAAFRGFLGWLWTGRALQAADVWFYPSLHVEAERCRGI